MQHSVARVVVVLTELTSFLKTMLSQIGFDSFDSVKGVEIGTAS